MPPGTHPGFICVVADPALVASDEVEPLAKVMLPSENRLTLIPPLNDEVALTIVASARGAPANWSTRAPKQRANSFVNVFMLKINRIELIPLRRYAYTTDHDWRHRFRRQGGIYNHIVLAHRSCLAKLICKSVSRTPS